MTQEMKKERRLNNMVWFELPVNDLNRATSFAMFPRRHETATTGALAVTHDAKIEGRPSTDGAVVYLNCDGEMDAVLKRAKAAGGELLQEVAQLPGGMGWIAQFRDLDGNRVGLHAAF
jgi:hypothetical protein